MLVLSVLFLPLVLLDDMTAIARLAGVGVAASIMYVLTISQAGIMNGIAGMGEGATNPPEYKLFPEENLMFQARGIAENAGDAVARQPPPRRTSLCSGQLLRPRA